MAFNSVEKRNTKLAKENKKLRHYGMKLRAIPTPKQHELILQSVGCARFTFNFYLNEKQEVYHETAETLSYGEFKRAFNGLKDHPEFKWLKIPDKFALECAMEQVDDAFDLEDLNVKGMIKNKKLSRSIADVSWSTFVTFVTYKAAWENRKVVFIDRFFASSKQCNGCHEKNTFLSLSDRIWVCPKCGEEHDRDLNAANNIKDEGIRILQNHTVLI